MSLPSFQLLRPKTLAEAAQMLAAHAGEVKVIAGGTDLLPSMKQKLFTPPYRAGPARCRRVAGHS